MVGDRGDGYGAYADHGDDDFRFGEDEVARPGAEHGNLMGRAEEQVRGWFDREPGEPDTQRLADDPRAVQAAEGWRRRFGREGHEGSWGLHDESYARFRQHRVEELDRDYEDWCREREQQFHRDFDDWRRQRTSGDAAKDDRGVGTLMQDDSSGPSGVGTQPVGRTSSASGRRRRASARTTDA